MNTCMDRAKAQKQLLPTSENNAINLFLWGLECESPPRYLWTAKHFQPHDKAIQIQWKCHGSITSWSWVEPVSETVTLFSIKMQCQVWQKPLHGSAATTKKHVWGSSMLPIAQLNLIAWLMTAHGENYNRSSVFETQTFFQNLNIISLILGFQLLCEIWTKDATRFHQLQLVSGARSATMRWSPAGRVLRHLPIASTKTTFGIEVLAFGGSSQYSCMHAWFSQSRPIKNHLKEPLRYAIWL